MQFLTYLPLAFCALATAAPTLVNVPVAADVAADVDVLGNRIDADVAAKADAAIAVRSNDLIASIESEIGTLGIDLNATIDELIDGLGLSATDDDVHALLCGLVGDVDVVVNDVEAIVGGTLKGLGLGGVDHTIVDLEKELGLSSKDTVGDLLKDLGVLH